jgi:DNA replication initiation complex subunit (GINS family)
VRIPGFLDDVRKLLPEEKKLYEAVVERCKGCGSPSLWPSIFLPY